MVAVGTVNRERHPKKSEQSQTSHRKKDRDEEGKRKKKMENVKNVVKTRQKSRLKSWEAAGGRELEERGLLA